MLQIGFTEKYFTLWNVNSTPRYSTDWTGKHHQVGVDTQYTYLQNLSMNESQAIEKAKIKGVTDTDVDVDLRGKNRSWKSYKSNGFVVDTINPKNFQFGKYSNESILESEDLGYIIWYGSQQGCKLSDVNCSEQKKLCVERVMELSDEYCIHNDEMILISHRDEMAKYEENREFLKEYGYYIATIQRNVDDHGMLFVDGIEFYFPTISYHSFRGWDYCLPKINGKTN